MGCNVLIDVPWLIINHYVRDVMFRKMLTHLYLEDTFYYYLKINRKFDG